MSTDHTPRPVRRVGRRRVTDAPMGAPAVDPVDSVLGSKAQDDTDIGWGEPNERRSSDSNDEALRLNKPPHWG